MSDNLYAPPVAEVRDMPVSDARAEFFVVGKTKFVLLFFATVGMYQLYWFYMHWARYSRFHQLNLWPAPRALFSIFFTHSLAGDIDHRLERNQTRYEWSPGAWATSYVILSIISNVLSRVPVGFSRIADALPILLLPTIAWSLWRIQHAANAACGQPEGESNSALTWANWIWLALGALFWVLVLIGLLLPGPA